MVDRVVHPSDQQYLIVTADDFGYDAVRDAGIVKCFTEGIVTRASLLVNGSSFKTTAIQLARENNMPLGLHLNLTEGVPVDDGNWTLTGKSSRFFRGKIGFREALSRGEIDTTHVMNEIDAQIRTFIDAVGYLPNHVDGHQHIQVLPEISETIAKAMQTYSLNQIRIPFESVLGDWFEGNKEFYNEVFQDAKAAMEVYRTHVIRFPDKFIGVSLMGKYMNVERILQAIEGTRHGHFCELMTHPGNACVKGVDRGCGDGSDDFACSEEREHEATVLRDPELKKRLNAKGISLKTQLHISPYHCHFDVCDPLTRT